MIHGENVILSIDGKAIAAAKSCQLDVNQNFIQVCSPVSGRWDSFVPSTIGWSASIDMMIVNMANPQAWLNEMKSSLSPLTMRYYDTNLGIYQVGQCYIKSWSNGAQVGSISTFSMQLQGSGELVAGEEWQNISEQCTFDASSLNPQPEGQQSIGHSSGSILITQDLTDTDLVWALLQNNNNVELKYFEFWNDREILPQQATYIHTQTDNRMKKIFIADEFSYGYKIIIPDIESGYKIKIVFDTLSSTINEVNMKVTIYKRLIK